MVSLFTLKDAVVDVGKRLYERGMLVSTEGNISVRLDDTRIMVTPSCFAKWRLSPEDMVIVDVSGNHLEGKNRASSELLMHLFVYDNRPEIAACVHSHPPFATSFAVAGIPLADNILPEIILLIGNIPLTEYASPGTEAVPKSLEPHIESCNAFLLRNHGLLTVGRTLDEAFNHHEMVEHLARVMWLARQLGNVEAIPSKEIKRLKKMRLNFDENHDNKS